MFYNLGLFMAWDTSVPGSTDLHQEDDGYQKGSL